jgi:hypothetical protein
LVLQRFAALGEQLLRAGGKKAAQNLLAKLGLGR